MIGRNNVPQAVRYVLEMINRKRKKTWILLVQRTRAKLIEHRGTAKRVSEIMDFEEPHEHAFTQFALELATTVENGIANGGCDRFILAGEPHCLGKIKKNLGWNAHKRLLVCITQDLFMLDNRQLYSTFADILESQR